MTGKHLLLTALVCALLNSQVCLQVIQIHAEEAEIIESNQCEFKYPVDKVDGNEVLMRTNQCHPRSSDSVCPNPYKSLATLEVTKADNSVECIFLTSDEFYDYGTFSFTDTGFQIVFDSPLEAQPQEVQDLCKDGMTFTANYVCDKQQEFPLLENSQFFDDNNQYTCHSEITFRSVYYCVNTATQVNAQVFPALQGEVVPDVEEQEEIENVCEARLPLEFESPNYLFFNKCRQRSQDSRCASSFNSVATLELETDTGIDCVFLSDENQFNQGDLDFTDNGYTLKYDIPAADAFAHCEAPTFTQKFECSLFQDGTLLETNFFNEDGKLACFVDITIATQSACFTTLKEKLDKLTSTHDAINPLRDALHKYQAKLEQSAKDKFNRYWDYLKNNKWFYFIVMLVLGIFYLLFGLRLFMITIFLFGMVSISLLALMVSFGLIVADDAQTWVGWIIFGVGVVLGILFGLLLVKCIKIGIFLLGAWPGAVCGLLLYNLFLHYIAGNVLLWIVVAALFVVGGLIALWLEDHAIIIGTAILGSYLVVRGSSLVIGGYPNEFTVYQEIKNKDTSSFSWQFILYLIVMGALAVLSIIWQERHLKNEDDESKENRHKYMRMKKEED